MNILTDEEIELICVKVRSLAGFEVCRAIEAAVMKKLAAQSEPVAVIDECGVIVVCSYTYKPGDKLFTLPQPQVVDFSEDDNLRFIQRVLESDAPKADKNDAAKIVLSMRRKLRKPQVAIDVELSEMNESNGNTTWSVSLAKKGDEFPWDWLQIYSDSIKGRAEYEADKAKHFFGLGPAPDILKYDTDPAQQPEVLK